LAALSKWGQDHQVEIEHARAVFDLDASET
jgi:hypothetical protein